MSTPDARTNVARALSILNKAMIVGIVMFSLASLLLHFVQGSFMSDRSLINTVLPIVAVIVAALIISARRLYKKRTAEIRESGEPAEEKLVLFRTTMVIHLALCEVSGLLSVICFMMFGNFLFFIGVGIALAEMISKYPSSEKLDEIVYNRNY